MENSDEDVSEDEEESRPQKKFDSKPYVSRGSEADDDAPEHQTTTLTPDCTSLQDRNYGEDEIIDILRSISFGTLDTLNELLGIAGYPYHHQSAYTQEGIAVVQTFLENLYHQVFHAGANLSSRIDFFFNLYLGISLDEAASIDSEMLHMRCMELMYSGSVLEQLVGECNFGMREHRNYKPDLVTKVRRVRDQFYNAHMFIRACTPLAKTRAKDTKYHHEADAHSFYPTLAIAGREIGSTDEKPFNRLLLHCLDKIANNRYKVSRAKGLLYREKLYQGNPTNAWVPMGYIEDYINGPDMFNLASDNKLWAIATNIKLRMSLTEHIRVAHYDFIKEVKRNQNVWSFTNGVYIGQADNGRPYFYEYGKALPPGMTSLPPSSKFFEMEFPTKTTVAEYIKQKIADKGEVQSLEEIEKFAELLLAKEEEDWYTIPTPALDQILDTQEFSEPVKRFFFVCLGRLFYPVDHLQFAPFLYGLGGTGKSTIINKLVKKVFCPEDVAEISSDAQRQFVTEGFLDRSVWIAPEVKRDFSLPQGVFQSLVSSETIEATVKGGKNKNIIFPGNGIMAGNEMPSYHGSGGAIRRRFVFFHFRKLVRSNDGTLPERLELEIPNFIRKCNLAYIEFLANHRHFDMTHDLPSEFKKCSEEILNDSNIVETMFQEGKFITGPNLYMPFTQFAKEIEASTRNKGKRMPNSGVDDSLCMQAFAEFAVEKEKTVSAREYPRHKLGDGANDEPKMVNDIFVMGVDVLEKCTKPEINRHKEVQKERAEQRTVDEKAQLLRSTTMASESKKQSKKVTIGIHDIYHTLFNQLYR